MNDRKPPPSTTLEVAHYQALLNAALEAVILIDEQQRIQLFNPAAESMFDYKSSDLLNHTLDILIPEEYRAQHQQHVDNFAKNANSQRQSGDTLTIQGRRSTGEIFSAEASISRLPMQQRVYLAVFLQDLTEKQHAHSRIESSEKRFRTLLSNLPGVVYRCQIHSPWRVEFISEGIVAFTGHTAEEFLEPDGVNYASFIHPDDVALVEQLVQQGIAEQRHFEIQYRILDRNGTVRWVQEKGICQYEDTGSAAFLDGFIHDITLQKLAELALRESEEQFRALAENIKAVFWIGSPDWQQIFYISPAFSETWGISHNSLYKNPMSWLSTVHPDDKNLVIQTIKNKSENRDTTPDFPIYRIVRPDDSIRWIHARAYPIAAEDGKVLKIAGIAENITDRKLAEQKRLEHERQQRATLVREVHHRIKNNLQGITGLLRQSTDQYPELRPAADAAVSQINTIALVHGLQSNNSHEQIILCELCEAIAQNIVGITAAQLKPLVTRQALLPIPLFPDEAVPIALILNELIFNAVKHQTKETQHIVDIDIDLLANNIVITIRNHGRLQPEGINIVANKYLGTGLTLVRALLPKGAHPELKQQGLSVITTLRLDSTLVDIPVSLLTIDEH